jgi:hypothetical protein
MSATWSVGDADRGCQRAVRSAARSISEGSAVPLALPGVPQGVAITCEMVVATVLGSQAALAGSQGVLSRSRALQMRRSLCMQAVRATLWGLPAAVSRW